MIEIVEGTVSDKWPQVEHLLRAHVDELTTHKHLMVLKPNYDMYAKIEATGGLLALFAYNGDEIVGYSVSLITTNMHYADLVYAHNDVLFVSKDHRASKLGLTLLRETEKRAAARGARMMIWHAKPNTNLDALLPRLGYGVQDILYSREL